MSIATNIVRRPGSASYYARIRIPKDLQEVVGKAERWESLRTSDMRVAKQRAPAVLHRWHAEFDEMRRRRIATTHDLAKAGWEHYLFETAMDARERAVLPSAADIERERVKAIAAIEALPPEQLESPLAVIATALDYTTARDAAELHRKQRDVLKQETKKQSGGRRDGFSRMGCRLVYRAREAAHRTGLA
jgi:hypothetical protein